MTSRPGSARRMATAAAAVLTLASVAACGSSGSSAAKSADSSTSSASAGASGGFPVTVKADGGSVTLKSQPRRIVSLSPTATEDLFAVGAGPHVVAVDSASDYPADAPHTSLSGLTPNIEAIAKYRPDLVVASMNTGGLVANLAKLGIPVMIEPTATSLQDAYDQIDQIGQATGTSTKAATVVSGMKSQIAASVAKAGSSHSDLTYFWEVSANPYYSATSSTFIGQVVGLFGLKNIADPASKAADAGYPQVTPEFIVTAKPDIIFLSDADAADGGQTPAIAAKRSGWSAIPAVKNGELIPISGDISSRWGPRLPQFVAAIAAAVEAASAHSPAA